MSHPNASNITLYANDSIEVQFHFKGPSHEEDSFLYVISVSYNNGTQEHISRGLIAASEGIADFDKELLYQKSYWANKHSLDKLFEVVVNHHKKFKSIEGVTVKVEYIYNLQRDHKIFVVGAVFDHTSNPTMSEAKETQCKRMATVAEIKLTNSPSVNNTGQSSILLAVIISLCMAVVGCVALSIALLVTVVKVHKMKKKLKKIDSLLRSQTPPRGNSPENE